MLKNVRLAMLAFGGAITQASPTQNWHPSVTSRPVFFICMKTTLMCFALKGLEQVKVPFQHHFLLRNLIDIRMGFPSREIFPGDLDGQWLSMALCLGRAALSVLKGG